MITGTEDYLPPSPHLDIFESVCVGGERLNLLVKCQRGVKLNCRPQTQIVTCHILIYLTLWADSELNLVAVSL